MWRWVGPLPANARRMVDLRYITKSATQRLHTLARFGRESSPKLDEQQKPASQHGENDQPEEPAPRVLLHAQRTSVLPGAPREILEDLLVRSRQNRQRHPRLDQLRKPAETASVCLARLLG